MRGWTLRKLLNAERRCENNHVGVQSAMGFSLASLAGHFEASPFSIRYATVIPDDKTRRDLSGLERIVTHSRLRR